MLANASAAATACAVRPAAHALVDRWLRRELALHPPRARSLVVTIWGDALAPHGGEVWLSTLIRLLGPFGINERLVRTSVFRLARDGWLVARASGRRSRYRLTPEGTARFAQAYRRVYTPPSQPWAGAWEIVLVPPDAVPAVQRQAWREQLHWNGHAAFAPGVYARPAVEGGSPEPPLPASHPAILRFLARDIPQAAHGTLASRAEAAWNLSELGADYRRFLARFARVAAAFASACPPAPAQAFLLRTLLVHEYRRTRLRDPQLPPALLPPDWPGAAAYALCRDCYRSARPLAEAYLAERFALDDERLPPTLPGFDDRFARAS